MYEPDTYYSVRAKNHFKDRIKRFLKFEYDDNCKDTKVSRKRFRSMDDVAEDFDSMRRNGHFSDAVIKCGSKSFHIHKNILTARSPVFGAMFLSPMRESQENMVVIKDIEAETFDKLLQFLYSGQLEDIDFEMAVKLLHAAEKYQVGGLRNICILYIKSAIDIKNCLDVLQCGISYDSGLKTFALSFIANIYTDFRKTDEWLNLQINNLPLAFEITSDILQLLLEKSTEPETEKDSPDSPPYYPESSSYFQGSPPYMPGSPDYYPPAPCFEYPDTP